MATTQTRNVIVSGNWTAVPFKLFTSAWNKPSNSPIRLFKVHQKVLTQGEVTQNFNKYQAQGLLNE